MIEARHKETGGPHVLSSRRVLQTGVASGRECLDRAVDHSGLLGRWIGNQNTRRYIKPIRPGLRLMRSDAKAESRRRQWPARSTSVKT